MCALHPAERRFAVRLQRDRRREWIAGRHCLTAALVGFSADCEPILPLESGAPTLPVGLAGSISHKGPLTVALVSNRYRGVGVDIECVEAADAALAAKVLTAIERTWLRDLDDASAALFVAALFATKEAIYKSVSPIEQSEIDFEQIELAAPPDKLIQRDEWVAVPTLIAGESAGISAALFLDEKWVIAVAYRE